MKRKILIILLLLVMTIFACSGFILLKNTYEDQKDIKKVQDISEQYTTTIDNTKSIDFDKLLECNKDVAGWIYIPDTNIDEPVLKGEDNNTYIRTGINKKYSRSGCLFMDEINHKDFSDVNTIIYGHNMNNGTKFADLKNYMDQDYFDSHQTIYLYTPDTQYAYTVVASGMIRKNSFTYKNTITSNEIISSSDICTLEKNTELKHVIMLSTCVDTGSSDRYVVWAVRNE